MKNFVVRAFRLCYILAYVIALLSINQSELPQ